MSAFLIQTSVLVGLAWYYGANIVHHPVALVFAGIAILVLLRVFLKS